MKFKDLLNLNKESLLPSIDRVRKRVLRRRARLSRILVVSCCFMFAVALGLTAAFFLRNDHAVIEEPKVVTGAINIIESVEANKKSEIGMKVDSSLKIKTSEDVSASDLRARLVVEPTAEYTVHKLGACDYELRFKNELEKNTLYNVRAVYNGKTVYRWAFQTETIFGITNASPSNETYVAADAAIEVTFSHADVSGFEEAFQITPEIKGTFEHYGRTWAFLPQTPLDAATLYTVTVQKGLMGPDSMNLNGDYRFSFTTAPQGNYAYLIYQQNEAADTFLVDEAPIAAICYDQIDVSEASVAVYRLEDSDAYIDAYKEYVRNGEVSPEIMALGKEAYLQFNTAPATSANYNSIYEKAAFINYPEPLPLGYYFAEIQIGGVKLYQLLQSTTLSVYTITSNGDYSVWVNDTESGEPLAGAKVELEGFKERKTGEQGIATFRGAEQECAGRVLVVEYGDYPYVVVLNGEAEEPEFSLQNNYFTYIATNSNLYKVSDSVKVFGAILPRKKDAKIPSEIDLRCDIINEEITAKVDKNGFFEAEISLNNTAASAGNIQMVLDDVWLASAYFTVADYELPLYEINVSTDKVAYQNGETVQVAAQVTYTDGTPAAGVFISDADDRLCGYTDENGNLFGSFNAELQNTDYAVSTNYPMVLSVVFRMEDGTGAYYSGNAEYMVFSSNYFLNSSYSEGRLEIAANKIDLNKAEEIDIDQIYFEASEAENFKGDSANLDLIGELHEITYEKVPNGTTYDAINKKVVYAWRYEEKDELVRSFEIRVVDGRASLKLPEKPDENKNYYVVLRVVGEDDAGVVKAYLTDYNYTASGTHTYNLVANKTTADIGESVELLVRNGSNNEAINSGSVLYTAVSGEIVNNFYSSSARYTLQFKEEYAPDVLIYGAYFDGKHVYSLGYEMLQYDLEKSELKITMEKDQLQYQPGDEVHLKFKVTDQNGSPVSAMLNLSVMDRALYLLSGEFNDPLYELYGSRCYGTPVYTTCSHREFLRGDLLNGEGGGGGGDYRGDFEDTPYFETVKTDSDGEAEVTFVLPDSITEWKVSARAVSEDVQAGMENFSLRSTRDYFVQISMGEVIKESDDFTVALKGEGLRVNAGAECTFQVGITDRDGNEMKTLNATAEKSQYAYLNFGQLSSGLYTVYIQSKCGDLQDNMIRTFKVEKNRANAWIHHQQAVNGTLSLALQPQRGNVTLTIVDEQQHFWQNAMARLRNNAGTRVDQVLGQYLADQFYTSGVWLDEERLDYSVLRPYFGYDGMKLQAESENSDLRVTAKVAAVAADFCDKETLQFVFEQYLNNRYAARVDVIISYFGLASLGKPVLGDLQTLYSTQSDFSPEEAAYLALAFAYSGDYDTARYIFDTSLKAYLVMEEDCAYGSVDGNVEEELTGCLALLSNRLILEYSEELINFIIRNDTEYTLLNLELISYLSDHVMEITGENVVNVSTGDGRNESYSYQKISALVLNLSPEQASDIRIMNVTGNSILTYSYNGGIESLLEIGEKEPMGAEIPLNIRVGEKATITLDVDIPGDFELPTLDLVLPAGLRLEGGTVQSEEFIYFISNRYNTDAIHIPLMNRNNLIKLEVRGALPGTYELEPIMITNASDNRFMATDAVEIHVNEEEEAHEEVETEESEPEIGTEEENT